MYLCCFRYCIDKKRVNFVVSEFTVYFVKDNCIARAYIVYNLKKKGDPFNFFSYKNLIYNLLMYKN